MHAPDAVRCSVVIPCYNGAATLGRQLRALLEQDAPVPFEIVVADNGSTDGSVEVAAALIPRASVVDASRGRGINVARNEGWREARGELILFCDADDLVHPGWIRSHWDAYAHGAALLGGALRRIRVDGSFVAQQDGFNTELGFLPWPTGANSGCARAVLEAVGGFDESLRGGGDETDLFWRAQLEGHRLAFVPDAVIDYTARPDSRGSFSQAVAFGRSHTELFRRFRHRGMPRASWAGDLFFVVRLAGRTLRSRFGERQVRDLVRFSGIVLGRARASIRLRVFYL